jgi:hypothetical protein
MANVTDPSKPDYTRPEVVKVQPDLDLVHDLLAGTRQMWEKSATYIRKWKDEQDEVYDIRRKIEEVSEDLGRTLSAAVGMLFAKEPVMEWNASEAAMADQWENLDAAGTAGKVLVKRFSDQAIQDGIGLILVDHPPAPEGVQVTAANEKQLGLRPTWALYQRAQAISWRTAVINNALTLTMLVLEECGQEDAGLYGVKTVKRYRILRLAKIAGTEDYGAFWELWKEVKTGEASTFARETGGVFRNRAGKQAPVIPVAIAYTGRTDTPLCSTIPLMGVAWANLGHWRQATNLRFYREVAAFPQPVVVGELAPTVNSVGASIPGKLRMGPMVAVHLQGEGASLTYAAPPTEAFEPLERGVKEKLDQMGRLGMSFLVSDTRAAETAEAKRLDSTAENATLATAAQGIQDAWNQALIFHAWYLGIEEAGAPVLTINRDFESVVMDAATMSAYTDAVVRAGLPAHLFLEALQVGGRLPEDADLEEIEREMMANSAAEEERKRQEMQDRATLMLGAA